MHFVHVWILDVKNKTYISNLELTQVTICINLSGFCMLNYRHDFEMITYLEHCLEWYKNKPQIWFCRSLNFLYIIKIAIRAVVWWLDLNLMQSLPFAAKQFFFLRQPVARCNIWSLSTTCPCLLWLHRFHFPMKLPPTKNSIEHP